MGLALDVIQFSGTLWLLFGESEENHTRCTHWQSSEIGMGLALVIACGTEQRAMDRGNGSASNGSAFNCDCEITGEPRSAELARAEAEAWLLCVCEAFNE